MGWGNPRKSSNLCPFDGGCGLQVLDDAKSEEDAAHKSEGEAQVPVQPIVSWDDSTPEVNLRPGIG